MPTKLAQVRAALAAHRDLVVVGSLDREPSMGVAQHMIFFVGVRTPLWHPPHLNALLATIVPSELQPESTQDFRKSEATLSPGVIYVKEVLAEIRREMTIADETDPDLPVDLRYRAGDIKKNPIELELFRLIYIFVYPTVAIAKEALESRQVDRQPVALPPSEIPKRESYT